MVLGGGLGLAKNVKKKKKDLFPEEEQQKPQPQKTPAPAPKPAPVIPKSEIIRDQETGKITAITTPEGKTFFASPKEIRNIAEKQALKFEAPAGTTEALQQNLARQQVEAGQQALQQQQNRPEVELPTQPQNIDFLQAIGGGISSTLPGVTAGAVTGAIGGAAVGGVGAIPGAIGGAAVGGVGGFMVGVRNSIKKQINEGITAKENIKSLKKNMNAAITDLNQGGNSAQDVAFFYENLDQLRINQAQIIADTKSVWAVAAGEDATIELEKYENFFRYELPILESELNQAILNPNPSKILVTAEESLEL